MAVLFWNDGIRSTHFVWLFFSCGADLIGLVDAWRTGLFGHFLDEGKLVNVYEVHFGQTLGKDKNIWLYEFEASFYDLHFNMKFVGQIFANSFGDAELRSLFQFESDRHQLSEHFQKNLVNDGVPLDCLLERGYFLAFNYLEELGQEPSILCIGQSLIFQLPISKILLAQKHFFDNIDVILIFIFNFKGKFHHVEVECFQYRIISLEQFDNPMFRDEIGWEKGVESLSFKVEGRGLTW